MLDLLEMSLSGMLGSWLLNNGIIMQTFPPTADLALQHILQGGLSIMSGEVVDEMRRAKLLSALAQIFKDANKGCQAFGAQNFLLAAEEPPAFERFVMLFRYLSRSFGSELPARLSEASQVLRIIESDGQPNEEAKGRVKELIQNLLLAISRESALRPLVAPKEVSLA
jgi:hypothetical protein